MIAEPDVRVGAAPEVAVVIPCKNAERWIGPTLTSVLNQNTPVTEIVVADDGSTDASREIVARHRDVRLLTGPFGGAARARTAGLEATTTPAVMFLDADDLLGRHVLGNLRAALPVDGIAHCDWRRYELRGDAWVVAPRSCAARAPWQDDLTAWLSGWYCPPCAVLWSRSAIEAAGGWRTSRANDDGDLMMRALTAGVELRPADGGIAYYRRLPDPTASRSGKRFTAAGLSARIAVIEGVAERLVADGRDRRYRAALATAFAALVADARAGVAELTDEHDECERAGRRAQLARVVRTHDHWIPHRSVAASPVGRRMARLVEPSVARRRRSSTTPSRERKAPTHGDRRDPLEAPLVSVVLPTFNRPTQTTRAIASVLEQTYAHLELIVVDDASTDDTPECVDAFDDERLTLLRQPNNRGVAAARNRGMGASRGELVAFLDSDDRWLPHKLEAQLDVLARAPRSTGVVATDVVEVTAAGTSIARTIERDVSEPASGDLFSAMLERNVLHGGSSSVLLTREAVETVGGFDEALSAVEDWDFLLRVTRLFTVEVVPEALVVLDNGNDRPRRSRDFHANMAARRDLHRRYRDDMRAAGCEQRFLTELARRHLERQSGSAWNGRKHVLQALAADPRNPRIYPWLGYMLLPPRQRTLLRALDDRSEPRSV